MMAALTTYEDVDVGDEFNVFIVVCSDVIPHALPAGRECLCPCHSHDTPHSRYTHNTTVRDNTILLSIFCSVLNVTI